MTHLIKQICYADDDADDHFIFSLALKEEFPAIRYEAFYHCGDLLKYLHDDNQPLPDMIFLDYNMPGNNGNECLRIVKKTAGLMHIPVIVYTTSNLPLIREQSYRDGAHKYLVKPSDFNRVREILRSTIIELETSRGS
ncbi:MAG: response regulator [Bacteroidota bacterium]